MSMRAAMLDVVEGAKNYQFWLTFGMNDIKAKYRRSKMGQWWITLSVAVFIFVIGGLYGGIFEADGETYMIYLATGYITFILIQDSVNTGCNILVQAKSFMMQRHWPAPTFAFRLIYRELLIMAHHAVLLPPIFIWMKFWPGFDGIFFALLGLVFTAFTAFWVILLLSIISLRYRDFPPIVQSLMRMAFFATPVIWVERNLGSFGELIILLNPFGYFLKIVRDPLLGLGFPVQAWLVALVLSALTALLTLFALSLTREKLSYWL